MFPLYRIGFYNVKTIRYNADIMKTEFGIQRYIMLRVSIGFQ